MADPQEKEGQVRLILGGRLEGDPCLIAHAVPFGGYSRHVSRFGLSVSGRQPETRMPQDGAMIIIAPARNKAPIGRRGETRRGSACRTPSVMRRCLLLWENLRSPASSNGPKKCRKWESGGTA